PLASVDILPGVASYVGADITAGAYAAGLAETGDLTLFIDVGTNGEIVLGNQDWMVTCACSAGPAFEGAGVVDGMRATEGAIEEVWIHSETFEPTIRVIGGGRPRGLCGSALVSLLGEMFLTGRARPGIRRRLARRNDDRPLHLPDQGRRRQPAARQGGDLRRLQRARRRRRRRSGGRPAGAHRRRLRQVHQRRESGAGRPAPRFT